jgi:transcriptional regulator with PAS, ATPase and Fis domain
MPTSPGNDPPEPIARKRHCMPPSTHNSDLRPAPANGLHAIPDDHTDRAHVNPSNGGSRTEMAVFSCDLAGNFTACDQAFTQLLGYVPEEILGKSFGLLFSREGHAGNGTPHPLDKDKDKDKYKADARAIVVAASEHGYHQVQLQVEAKSGKSFRIRLSLTLLREAASSSAGLVGFVTPISDETSTSTTKVSQVAASDAPPPTSREIDGIQFILASPVMHKFMGMVDRVAGHTETVLVTGETGTGKELIARSVHESSPRRNRPWIDINCAALPENLVESELFGYEKGAFSGADASKPGLFELADRGTLFLDEIGELQLQTQVKLLRVLDGQPFYRLGGHRKIKVEVRIVAATNQNLESAVQEGRFRKDLFHRLGQFQLRVPPLRERPEDIVALAEHFLRLKAPAKSFSNEAISALLSHPWPGNIRELRNLVAKIAMESPGPEVDFAKVTAAISGEPAALRQTASMPVGNLDSMEEQMIIKALERTGGQRALAAEQLGISRRTLSRKLKEYNINFAAGGAAASMTFISNEQQKFFRARVQIPVTLKNSLGEEINVQGVNLSTGGMGLDGLAEPLRFSGLLDVSFNLPDGDNPFQAKARLMWVGDEKRVGIRFVVIEPALFEQLQHWCNKKMKEEGWDFPA